VVTIVNNNNLLVITKTLAVVSLLVPVSGHALGIGEIKLHSALNQNLDAEISLSLSGESISDIKVSLAPPDKFKDAGVSWSYFLSKIKFDTLVQTNGSVLIKLTSQEVLKEPFLDFLLEVSWPKGSLYREFTVLVDPPAVYNQVSTPVSTPFDNYVKPSSVTLQGQLHVNTFSNGEYGPTQVNDTLWSVAEHTRGQSDVSVEQMMLALYQANPDAFYKGNVNALTAGKMLNIPEREAILKLSRSQALAEFSRHTKAWKKHSSSTPAEVPVPSKIEGVGDNQLKLVAPEKEAVKNQSVTELTNEQVIVDNKQGDVLTVAPSAVNGKPEEARQDASASVQTEADMHNKMVELEKQLVMMQKLVALKDQQLAALQSQYQVSPIVQNQPVSSELDEVKPADQGMSSSQQVVVQPVVQLKPESNTLYYQGVVGIGMVVLSALGWLWWRKRKVDELTNTESMFASSNLIDVSEGFSPNAPNTDENISVLAGDDQNVGSVGESSFLSELTPSDFDSFDTDQGEIDPISEADVYLAYGRYQQAEELIRQAIKVQPNRNECKLKLLEIFCANEDKVAFEGYVNELIEAGKQNESEFWGKVAEMGREICPNSPLFSSRDDSLAGEQESNGSVDFDFSPFSMDNKEAVEINKDVTDTRTLSDSTSELDIADNKHEFESHEFDLSSSEPESVGIDNYDLSALGAENSQQKVDVATDNVLELNDEFGGNFDFNFDVDLPNTSSEQGSSQDEKIGVSDITDMDELETKLDLVKAYVDMGDADSAKELAIEVLEQGSVEQKKVAQALIDELK
jgi:pilus assembly protein FimV